MAQEFLEKDVPFRARDFAGMVNKLYQRLNLAGRIAEVDRLRRQAHRLSGEIAKAKEAKQPLKTQHHLRVASGLVHECVPLLSLCVQHKLLSQELYELWTAKLEELGDLIDQWREAK